MRNSVFSLSRVGLLTTFFLSACELDESIYSVHRTQEISATETSIETAQESKTSDSEFELAPPNTESSPSNRSNDQTETESSVVDGNPDINGDGIVNSVDLAILLSAWGSDYAPADLNGDGIVNAQDLAIFLSYYGSTGSSSAPTDSEGDGVTWSPWDNTHEITQFPMTLDGWTDLEALVNNFSEPSQSRVIYVSSSQGDDATGQAYALHSPEVAENPFQPSGQVQSFKTLAAGYAQLRDGHADLLLLARGDEWINQSFLEWHKSGKSALEPMIVGAYGNPGLARPRIRPPHSEFGVRTAGHSEPLDNLVFYSLDMEPYEGDGQTRDLVGLRFIRTGSGLLIEDCRFKGFANNLAISGTMVNGRQNLHIRRNLFTDPYLTTEGNTNVFVESVTGILVEENYFINQKTNDSLTSDNGTLLSHGIYLSQANTPGTSIVRGNIFHNARTNITARGGGLIENNLSIRGGGSITSSLSSLGNSSVNIIDNVVVESRNHWNGDLLGQGIHVQDIPAEISRNIVFGATDGSSHAGGISLARTHGSVMDNIVYAWSRPGEGMMSPALVVNAYGPIVVNGNQLIQTGQNQIVVWDRTTPIPSNPWDNSLLTWTNNAYYTPRSQQFFFDEDRRGYWFETWGEVGAVWAGPQTQWPESLEEVIGVSTDALVESIIQNQRLGNWSPDLTAPRINDLVRAAFSP